MALASVFIAAAVTTGRGPVLPVTKDPVEIAPNVFMPRVNLGTCCGSDPAVGLVPWINAGATGIDTAYDYKDQPVIAQGLHNVSVPRGNLFITTKIPPNVLCDNTTKANVFNYIQQDLDQLQMTYVDLVLLHHPCPDDADNVAIWQWMEEAVKANMTRSIGVSNFKLANLQALAKNATITPSVNQCHMAPGKLDDPDGFQYCQQHGIVYESYGAMKGCKFSDPQMMKIASGHNVTVSQVCLRWVLQMGAVVAVGTGSNASTVGEYTKENLDLFGFNLTDSEMKYISGPAPAPAPSPPPPPPPPGPPSPPPTPTPTHAPTALTERTTNFVNYDIAVFLFVATAAVVVLLISVKCGRSTPTSMYTKV